MTHYSTSKKVLITGGTGFFGKSILDYFSRHSSPYDFTILSRHGLKYGYPNKQILGDVRTFDLGSTRFDYVIHAATPARIDVPDGEMRSIILDGTANAIRQARKCGATRFMMVSSGGIYGSGFTHPISETDKSNPYTAYGQAKLLAEQMAVDSGLYTLLPRCFAFVGRYLDRTAHFAIGNFIRDALSGHDIIIKGDGSPIRSYLYADDLVEWLFAILEHGVSSRPYNVGSAEAITIRDLAILVRDTLKSSSKVRVSNDSVPGATNCYLPDIQRASHELGLIQKISLQEAIRLSAC